MYIHPSVAEPFSPDKFLVLVVDDVNQNLQVVGSMLDEEGYATTFATSGKQALERVHSAHPDLILLDLMMPEMDGLEVCERLKSEPALAQIPIIFFTASHEKEHLLQAFEKGAVDYITKPFNAPELLARVRTHLELKHTQDELKKALVELEKLAITDPLTGIFNRRHLFKLAEMEFQRANRYDRAFAVLMIDIDHFKLINDTYGHGVGDDALKLMTEAIRQSLRTVDFLGRFGGEEFIVFLPETNATSAVEVAERIRQQVTEINLEQISCGVMTVSIGVASYHPEDATIDMVLQRADTALYQAKHQGRNRVILHQLDFPTHASG